MTTQRHAAGAPATISTGSTNPDEEETVNLCGAPSAAEETTNSSSVAATVDEATDENATGDESIDLSDDAASDYEFYVYDDSDDEARDITELFNDAPPGVPIALVEHKANVIHALVQGPVCTPYQCGFFHFVIHFPAEYPIKPPCVRLMNTDGGRVRFNLNLQECGKGYYDKYEEVVQSNVDCTGTVCTIRSPARGYV
ncbi:hypothetical protein HPB50_007145 [Hyalomma asiaticum]|uniref:Uncharacterized protein n=1 Tax=Hyalomma asiaticum TaxID=266040 RepID=A0ACB7TDS8_HYAAI|nr:hypothetical protein HPB50_007145 [Hyalomma asiaticum]